MQVTVIYFWYFCLSVVGAPSRIILIGTGSGASVHQRKLSQRVSLQNTHIHLIRYYSILSELSMVYPLTVFSLVDVFQLLSSRHAESQTHVRWIHVWTEASASWSQKHTRLSAHVLRASLGHSVSRVGTFYDVIIIIILWMTSIIELFCYVYHSCVCVSGYLILVLSNSLCRHYFIVPEFSYHRAH